MSILSTPTRRLRNQESGYIGINGVDQLKLLVSTIGEGRATWDVRIGGEDSRYRKILGVMTLGEDGNYSFSYSEHTPLEDGSRTRFNTGIGSLRPEDIRGVIPHYRQSDPESSELIRKTFHLV